MKHRYQNLCSPTLELAPPAIYLVTRLRAARKLYEADEATLGNGNFEAMPWKFFMKRDL